MKRVRDAEERAFPLTPRTVVTAPPPPEILIWRDLPLLSTAQRQGVDRVCDPNVKQGQGFFLTGEAGAGKSVVVKAAINRLSAVPHYQVYVTGTTGVAALEIGGNTIHSFLGMGPDLSSTDVKLLRDKIKEVLKKPTNTKYDKSYLHNLLLKTTHLIIDEISMLPAQAWTNLDLYLRAVRGKPNTPFGGMIVIAVGDFFQLPPVPDDQKEEGEEDAAGDAEAVDAGSDDMDDEDDDLDEEEAPLFAFQSPSWGDHMEYIFLPGSHRQGNDSRWAKMLSEIRRGIVTDETDAALRGRVLDPPSDGDELVTYLFPRNGPADRMNQQRLALLPGQSHIYESRDDVPKSPPRAAGTPERKSRDPFVKCRALKRLELKLDAQVMLLRNMKLRDFQDMKCPLPPGYHPAPDDMILVNGSVGKIMDFQPERPGESPSWPVVSFPPYGTRPVAIQVRLKRVDFPIRRGSRQGQVPTRYQIPIVLCYATSIHKSQGRTLTCDMVTDLGHVFAHGQAYVALSRIGCLSQLYLQSYDRTKITAHPAVLAFDEAQRRKQQEKQ